MTHVKQPLYLVGLNVMRLFAVILMFITHSFRIQADFKAIYLQKNASSVADQVLVFFMQIEPLTSVLFLFIAGVSLALAKHKLASSDNWLWFMGLWPRLFGLYVIAVILFLFGHSWQFPAVFLTPGILSAIAVALGGTALLLISAKPNFALSMGVCLVSLVALGLDERSLSIVGVNSGPGCILPLAAFCLLGALAGRIYLFHGMRGLLILALMTLPFSIAAVLIDYPWTIVHKLTFLHFNYDPVQNGMLALQYLLGESTIEPQTYQPGFWNQSAIFLPRTAALLFVILAIFIACFSRYPLQNSASKVVHLLNYLGKHALFLYVFHLIILAVLSLSGITPGNSWQTLTLVFVLLASGGLTLYGTQRVKLNLIKKAT